MADGVNVDGEVYRIRTRVGDEGNTVEAGEWVGKRDKLTRAQRMELLDQDFAYDPETLDRAVVAPNQIRTILQTFKERLPGEIFPGRSEVPKTLIFAKDDSHAEDIVHIAREVFGRGDEFCKKITYQAQNPEQAISDFRNAYNPRIAVTVDMIATGTDIKPIEILVFMRAVKSRILFEQMLGRGTRIISETDIRAVNPGEVRKDHFVIVDAVGIVEQEKVDTQTLERKRSVSFEKLMGLVAAGAVDEETVSSLAGRLIRLRKDFSQKDAREVDRLAGEGGLPTIINRMLNAIDDSTGAAALPPDIEEAVRPLASNPALRNLLVEIKWRSEQVIDESADALTRAGFDDAASERARVTVESFRAFIETHKDEITALQIIYSIPRGGGAWHASEASDGSDGSGRMPERMPGRMPSAPTPTGRTPSALTYAALKELAEILQQPPNTWTTEALWRAYAQLERDRARKGASERRVLTDLVSLVRHALSLDDELVPYPDKVAGRYRDWLAAQEAAGRAFSAEQRWWLDRVAEAIGVNVAIAPDDLNAGEFYNRGGQVAAMRVFGRGLGAVLDELNAALGEG